jgi:hypothetical protein
MDWIELLQRFAPDSLLGMGSLIVLVSSCIAQRRLSRKLWDWQGHKAYLEEIRSAISSQSRDQAIGFLLFAVGFAMKLFWTA